MASTRAHVRVAVNPFLLLGPLATSSSWITGLRWMHSEQLCCSTSFFSKLLAEAFALAMSPARSNHLADLPRALQRDLALVHHALQGTPITTSCSRLILFR